MDAETARLLALARIAWDRILRGEDGIAVLLEYGRDVRALDALALHAPAGTWDEERTPVHDLWQPGETLPPDADYEPRELDERARTPTHRAFPAPPPVPPKARRRKG